MRPGPAADGGSDRLDAALTRADAAAAELADRGPGRGTMPPRAHLSSDAPRLSLSGEWWFRLSPSIRSASDDDWQERADAAGWHTLPVPAHWNLHGHGAPAYSNVQFPFPVDPPFPPDENPIGDYRRVFDAPEELLRHPCALRFDGIESAATVWLNGVELGTTRGSRLRHEFDVSRILRASGNVLAVRVAQFSAASYLEDQDMWWLPGIFRDVTLLARPRGGIADVFVHAGYDHVSQEGTLSVDAEVDGGGEAILRVPELGVEARAGEQLVLPVVEPWSAESPRLYDATVSTPAETVALRIGFRTVTVEQAVLLVNGRPVLFRGVNRHEHHPEHGRVFSAEHARAELVLMKQHNINAIRMAHYPPHPDVLDLADELGFYVIDECDLETHGFELVGWRQNPSGDPAWRAAYLDRMQRTVHRDKNHPAVLMWSLGNEAGTGANLEAMAEWTKAFDPDRLVHYEGDWSSRYVDVYSRMYASHEEVERIGREREEPASGELTDAERHRLTLPFIQCEYAHAMGTGPGGIREYQELFERYPRLAGGFVWEWVEHGLAVERDGRRAIAYGGDFGERVHDGNFVIDGLVSADREPRPSLADYAALIAPVRMRVATGDAVASVEVENRYDLVGLDHLELRWRRERDGQVVASGVLPPPALAPGEAVAVELPSAAAFGDEDASADQVLVVEASLAAATSWAPRGHVVASTHTALVAPVVEPPVLPATAELEDGLIAFGPARFDRTTGELVSLGGVAVMGPRVGLWRAPTDNDRARGWDEPELPPMAERWHTAGLDRLVPRLLAVETGDDVLAVTVRTAPPITDAAIDARLEWRVIGPDAVRLDVELTPVGPWSVDWARLGLDLTAAGQPLGLEYFGDGPGPAYPDTGDAAAIGWWTIPADELVTPHVRPQESGARRAVRRAAVLTRDAVLRVSVAGGDAEGGVALTVSPFERAAVVAATHADELRPDGSTHISIDVAQSGVGTATCGPGVLPQHRLPPRGARFSLTLAAGPSARDVVS